MDLGAARLFTAHFRGEWALLSSHSEALEPHVTLKESAVLIRGVCELSIFLAAAENSALDRDYSRVAALYLLS